MAVTLTDVDTLTIAIPIEVQQQAEQRALLEGTTLAEIICQRLAEYAAGLEAALEEEAREQAEDIRLIQAIEEGVANGETLLYDWDEVKAELDALPSEAK